MSDNTDAKKEARRKYQREWMRNKRKMLRLKGNEAVDTDSCSGSSDDDDDIMIITHKQLLEANRKLIETLLEYNKIIQEGIVSIRTELSEMREYLINKIENRLINLDDFVKLMDKKLCKMIEYHKLQIPSYLATL